MLELLAQGASTRGIARRMGYSEGTVRVYLHNLYRKLGVRNRTQALLWQIDQQNRLAPQAAAMPPRSVAARADESFGDVAVREGLLYTLGIMESFLGPYGRVWEVATRLKGMPMDEKAVGLRDEARMLWRALLQGTFGYGKSLHDEGAGERLADESPSECVLLVALLILGGYSNAADGYVAQLGRARKAGRAASQRELNLLRALREAIYANDDEAVTALYQLAAEKSGPGALKQVASVALFHVYRLRKDMARASEVASALWAEAEAGRRQLEAMGLRPLDREAVLPKPARAGLRTREKAAAGT